MTPESMELGQKLKAHRLASGLTGVQVAQAMEVSPSTVSRWEKGEYSITVVHLRLLAQVLGIDEYWELLR